MGTRIQARDIDIPKDDPFKNDLLDRRRPVGILTQLVEKFEGPCVLAIDSDWGNGKTTFIKMWTQHTFGIKIFM